MIQVAGRVRVPGWFVAVLAVVAVAGAYAIGVRTFGGLRTTNLTSPVPWGLWVALYIYFVGLSAGSFLLSSLPYVFGLEMFERIGRVALFSSLVMIGAGLVFVLLDLGHMERFVTVYTHPQWASVLSWEIFSYVAYMGIAATELWLLLRVDLAALRDRSHGFRRLLYRVAALGFDRTSATAHRRDRQLVGWIALVGLPVAMAVEGGPGALFAVAKARPFWFSPLLPVVFVASAVASAAGLLAVVHWMTGDRDDPRWASRVHLLGTIAVSMVSAELLMLSSEVLVGMYSGIPEHLALFRTLLFGPFAWVFWGWQVGVGSLIPIALHVLAGRRAAWVPALCGGLVMFGAVAVRLDIVVPSLTVPVLPGLGEALADPRTYHDYFPSWVEWLSSAGLAAATALAWIAGFRLLPIAAVEQGGGES